MKKILFALLSLSVVFAACNDDEMLNPGEDLTNRLNYDAENFSAPALPEGKYEAAVRFTSTQTADYQGKQLEAVELYLFDNPVTTEIIIYGAGDANQPGDRLYSASVGSQMQPSSWNTHTLAVPIDITEEDIWIAVKVDHPQTIQSVGCDPGPAVANGDFLFVNSDNSWTNLRGFTNGETSINWNIRGVVSE